MPTGALSASRAAPRSTLPPGADILRGVYNVWQSRQSAPHAHVYARLVLCFALPSLQQIGRTLMETSEETTPREFGPTEHTDPLPEMRRDSARGAVGTQALPSRGGRQK
jgi:hypothetical protein